MAEMQELYDAGMARLEDIMVYVDARFPLKGCRTTPRRWCTWMQSIVMVSFPVEVWKQPRVLDSGAAYIQLHQGAGGLSVLTLKAAGLLDVDAGEIVRPGIVRVDGDRDRRHRTANSRR